jgi:hypothetical protein
MISGISSNYTITASTVTATSSASTVNASEQVKEPSYDTFEKSHTYDAEKATSLKETLTAQQTILKDKLMSMISEQTGIYNLSINNTKFQVSDEEIEWAKQAIAEGGEYSVDAVASNIMDMAKALSGNNSEYISLLKSAVDMGFSEAAKVFGGNMPDITSDTYNEIMKRFDEWEQEFADASDEIIEEAE